MIQFPETAAVEWKGIADEAAKNAEVKRQIDLDTRIETAVQTEHVRHHAKLRFQQELDSASTPALEMFTMDTYKSDPAKTGPADLIDGVLKDHGLCVVIGSSGSGKSTTALQMCNSLLTGEDFLGQTAKPITGAVAVISYDQDGSLTADWMAGFPNVDQSKIIVVNAYKRGNPLNVPEHRAAMVAGMQHANVEVIVIDSFSASFFGHDQNDAAATMAHYRALLAFGMEVGARSTIVVSHAAPGSPDRARGSTVHHDVADSIMSVDGQGTDPRKIKMVKYRAGRGQEQMSPVIVGAPDPLTHLVEVDVGMMAVEGWALPASLSSSAFSAVPEPEAEPDTDSDSGDEENDL